jgi:molecular chaperone GrpE
MKKENKQKKHNNKKEKIEAQGADNLQKETQQTSHKDETMKEKKSELDQIKEELKQEKDKYLRLYAEFENFRKRTAKEKLELFETAGENLVKELLPVLDDFERALSEIKKEGNEAHYKGVELIYEKFKNTLKKSGLKDIEVNKGDQFDPESHEAIAQVPGEEDMKGKVVDVVEKGYAMGKKTIRYPKVVTGS